MPLSNYRELLPRMIDNLRGCNQDRIPVNALKDAGRQFCERTKAWRIELDPIDIVANQQSYDLEPYIPWDATPIVLEWVKLSGDTAQPVPESYYTLDGESTLKLADSIVPETALADGLIVKLALLPHLDSVELSEWFMERYADAIVGKAMYDLLMQGGKPWFNEKLAQQYLMNYRRGINAAIAEVTRGNKPGPDYLYG